MKPALLHTADVPLCFFFGIRIPYLPDLLADRASYSALGDPVAEAYARQISFLRAVTALPVGRCGLQLRFIASADETPAISVALLGAATDARTALDLLDLVVHARPPEVNVEVLEDEGDVAALLDPLPAATMDHNHFAEIRRSLEPVGLGLADETAALYGHIVMPWRWTAQSFTHTLGILRAQDGAAVLAVHVEPRAVTSDAQSYLVSGARHFLSRREDGDMLQSLGYETYLARASGLRRAALHVRVFVASHGPLLAGTAEYLGSDLTRISDQSGYLPQSFEVVRPHRGEETACAERLLRALHAAVWGVSEDVDEELAELLFLMDPVEANCVFRVPITPSGGLPGIATAVTQLPGGRVRQNLTARDQVVHLGSDANSSRFGLSHDDINQHVLVAGVPGSGKSSTVRTLLRQLVTEDEQLKFLVVDPAKTDYSAMADIATVVRLELGTVAFNPFAVPVGASVTAHGSRLLAAFDNAFRLGEVFPLALNVLDLALRAAYRETGTAEIAAPKTYWPTLAQLYRQTKTIIVQQRFSGEIASSLRGSLLARIESLIDGGLGVCIAGSPRDAIDWHALFDENTVVELGAFAAPADRNLLFGLLFCGLIGWREANPQPHGLRHVTVLEEAHRLLRDTGQDSYAVALFSDAIAELRGAGEGFIVVDQAPSTLVKAVSKSTGTKIAHRLVDGEERHFMSDAMVLSPVQQADLARLVRGRVLVLSGSLEDAIVVDTDTRIDRQEHPPAGGPRTSFVEGPLVQRPWCQYCASPCRGGQGLGAVGLLYRSDRPRNSKRDEIAAFADRVDARLPGATDIERFCAAAATISLTFHNEARAASEALVNHRDILLDRSQVRQAAQRRDRDE